MDEKTRDRLIRENFEVAKRFLMQKLRDPSSIPDGTIVIPLNVLAMGPNPFTTSRWQVLMEVRNHGRYARLQDLADALGRGKHRVSKDVDVLARFGLVEKHRLGRETAVEPTSRTIFVA